METVFNQSIWGDEGFSAILSMKSLPEIIKIIINDTSPPLWNITEWIVFNTLGTEEVYIRGLAFTFFALATFFTYKTASLLWDKKTGILAATLTFLNPFFFTYAFEGRMYSILALGVSASMYFFAKIINSKKSKSQDLVAYVIATLWAMYSHHFAIFALFIQGLWFIAKVISDKGKAIRIFKAFILVGIGYLPWVIPLYKQTKMVGGGFWLGTPTIKDLLGLIAEYLAAGIRNESLKIPLTNIPLFKASLCLVIFTLVLRSWGKKPKETLFAASWFLGPIILTWVVSQFFQSIFFNRYLLYAIPGAMLVLASNRKGVISKILISAIILLFSIINWHYFTHPIKRPFAELSAYVKSTQRQGDFLINWNSASHHLWETKYYGIPAPIYISGRGELPFFVGTALMEESDVINTIPNNLLRVGVVTSGPIEEISLPGYTESEVKIFKKPWENASDIKFVWYVKD